MGFAPRLRSAAAIVCLVLVVWAVRNRTGDEKIKDETSCGETSPSSSDSCITVSLAVVCVGSSSSRRLSTLVKSVVFHSPDVLVHLHLITDNVTAESLDVLFKTWAIPQVKVTFYSSETWVPLVSWVPNKHYSGVHGLMKLALPSLLPPSLNRVIVLDTDVALADDISALWSLFSNVSALGLVENASDWYLPGSLWHGHQPWPATGRGFNTGVILINLKMLRDLNWDLLWRSVAESDLVTMLYTSLADQDVFNAVVRKNPHLVTKLPCRWNVQLSDNTKPELCIRNIKTPGLIHLNSREKRDVSRWSHADAQLTALRNHVDAFHRMDGTLVRRWGLGRCGWEEGQGQVTTEERPFSDNHEKACREIRDAASITYRTHPNYFSIRTPSPRSDPNDDITLVSHLTADRLHMVTALAEHWPGPISLALFASDEEVARVVDLVSVAFVTKSGSRKTADRDKGAISFHVVYKEGAHYPVNLLRNVAMARSDTKYAFISDIDFLPGKDVYAALRANAESLFAENEKAAVVVPAFQGSGSHVVAKNFPKSKADVIAMLDEGMLAPFRQGIWPAGHAATDYGRWRTATVPYPVAWQPDYEPFVVVALAAAPAFDTRFVGFGWNKVSYTMQLEAEGFELVVATNAFSVHVEHAPSNDVQNYRLSKQYRRCLFDLKKQFSEELNSRFGTNFTAT